MASLILQIVKVTTHLLGRYFSWFSPHLKFFLLRLIPLSSFPWFRWWKLWLFQMTLSDVLSIPVYYPALLDHVIGLFVVNTRQSYIIIINIIIPLGVFLISVSGWFPTGVWVTASRLKSPVFFSVFWVALIML